MTDPAPQNRGYYWAVLFFRALYDHGVSHAVISPGSRSTPLTLATASHPGFHKHVVLDERSAAFTALGIGKATGTPAVLISTSGTALANYYPAVIESRLSGVPLILATADRPPHLRNTGANQAIDQLKIFGQYPVFSHEVGEPLFDEKDISRLKMLAGQAVDSSMIQKGPVHLNFPFRKPLEPEPDFVSDIEQEHNSNVVTSRTAVSPLRYGSLTMPSYVRQLIDRAERPLIIAGPLAGLTSARPARLLAELIKAPVLAEGGFSSPHAIHGFEGFLRSPEAREALAPDLILRFGFQPTGKAVELALKKWKNVPHVHFTSSNDWHDATYSVSHRINWQEKPVEWNVEHKTGDSWLNRWKSVEKEFSRQADQQLSEKDVLSDLHVYHYLTPQIPEYWSVFLSNSFPVRDSLLAGRYQTSSIFVNRGASGIDGITSTAIGINLALDQPTVLFTGDLAFLHDTNALLSNKLLKQSLIVVVLNNQGGNVFRMLPIVRHKTYYKEYFETPQSAELSSMARTYGLPYTRVNNIETLTEIDLVKVARATGKGIHIIECQTDSDASMKYRNILWSGNYAT